MRITVTLLALSLPRQSGENVPGRCQARLKNQRPAVQEASPVELAKSLGAVLQKLGLGLVSL